MTTTAIRTITKQHAVRALERVVERHGADTVYRDRDPEWDPDWNLTCRNVDNQGQPLCIVGVALVEEFGVDGEMLLAHAGSAITSLSVEAEQLGLAFDRAAVDVLAAAQYSQDRGRSWGEALASAKRV